MIRMYGAANSNQAGRYIPVVLFAGLPSRTADAVSIAFPMGMIRGEADRMVRPRLDTLIAEATVDCYNDSVCATGFLTKLDGHLALPFPTTVLDLEVTVAGIDLTEDGQIVAVCTAGRSTQRIPILDLPLPMPQPNGAEWIAAYRHWIKGA